MPAGDVLTNRKRGLSFYMNVDTKETSGLVAIMPESNKSRTKRHLCLTLEDSALNTASKVHGCAPYDQTTFTLRFRQITKNLFDGIVVDRVLLRFHCYNFVD